MIYFDNAATTWPKPPEVMASMRQYMEEIGANPGRSGHKLSVQANTIVDNTRELLAQLFKTGRPGRIIFTLNATDALNTAIKGMLKPGDHVITSSMEHNSVTRPLYTLTRKKNISVTKVSGKSGGPSILKEMENALQENTRAIIILHASNVTGELMPVQEIGRLARDNNLLFLLDAAQTAGMFDIDMPGFNLDLLAVPGHKGLMGPPGTGVLAVGDNVELSPLREGGTGSYSDVPGQPEVLPEKYESGTLNMVGIAGLEAGVKWIMNKGLETIREHEAKLLDRFLQGAGNIKGLTVYGTGGPQNRAPVVSFALEGKNTTDVGAYLDSQYGIACRAGLHCAPDAHRTLGTFEQKLVRFSFSYFNTLQEVDYALQSLDEIARQEEIPAAEGCGC